MIQLDKPKIDDKNFSNKNKKITNYFQYPNDQKTIKYPHWNPFEKLNKHSKRSFQKVKNYFNRNNYINSITASIDNIDKETGAGYKIVVIDPENTIIQPNRSNGLMTLANRKYENKSRKIYLLFI